MRLIHCVPLVFATLSVACADDATAVPNVDASAADASATDATPTKDLVLPDLGTPDDISAVDASIADAPVPFDDAPAVDVPAAPDVPAAADAPAITDAPVVIDAPAVTDVPVATDVPAVLDAPVVTDVPAVTDVPVAADAHPAVDGGVPSGIQHVVVIVQENHTFDAYFGRYCTAATGSNPTCTDGPACCEAAPAHEPSGAAPTDLTDSANANYDPNHGSSCEASEMNGGRMDRYVRGASCSDSRNFAVAAPAAVDTYHHYAQQYAMADRYFQPIIGATAANDMYLAVAREVFQDNNVGPRSISQLCGFFASRNQYTDATVADVVLGAGHSFAHYSEGYAAARRASPFCASVPSDCPAGRPFYPCSYDPSDTPFQYYQRFTDNPTYIKDYADFTADVTAGRLPDVAYVKGLGYHTEHPGSSTTVRAGMMFVDGIVQRILGSPIYGQNTLILVTWDEGGGFFDHVTPPATSAADHQDYGTRVPLLAIGRFARRNFVSHVTLEHSSIVRFLEWNFTGSTGQLHARDALVNNLGSLLDPAQTGVPVPAN